MWRLHLTRCLALIFCSGFIGVQDAASYPQFIAKGYTNCASCHYAPDGGAMANAYGVATQQAFLPDAIEVEFLEDGGVSVEGEGHVHAPWGFDGGSSGETAHMSFRPTQGNERRLPSKLPNLSTRAGDRIEVVGPSGGGYGNPFERDPIQVCEDVIDGYLSPERALTDYGVVITQDKTVDDAATASARTG